MPPNVFGFCDGGACGYYRVTLPLDYLAHKGWDIQTAVGWDERAKGYRVILGQRVGKTHALPIWRRLLPGRRLIWESDDDVWNIDPTNLTAKFEHNPVVMDAIEQSIRISHAAVTSTGPLAELVRRWCDDVTVLPNHVDGRLLSLGRPQRERVTVGWAGGDSHLKDWGVAAAQVKRFMRRNPQVDLHVIGADFAKIYGIPARHTGWSTNIWDYYASVDFDVGIAPLADIPFNRSKSPIKAIEYGALGIPVIASAVGPYRDYVLDGVTGFLVREEHEWGRYLRLLTTDHGLRAEMGAKAKEQAAEWTIQKGWRRWADVFERLAG